MQSFSIHVTLWCKWCVLQSINVQIFLCEVESFSYSWANIMWNIFANSNPVFEWSLQHQRPDLHCIFLSGPCHVTQYPLNFQNILNAVLPKIMNIIASTLLNSHWCIIRLFPLQTTTELHNHDSEYCHGFDCQVNIIITDFANSWFSFI